jgi:hypothetical protein
MMNFELLYSRQCPKSLNAEQSPKGAKLMTLDEILNVISRIQSKFMVGSFVWEVRVALDYRIKRRLIAAMAQQLEALKIEIHLAEAMASAAVREVCDTNICDKCHGTGQAYSRKYAKLFECKKCEGKCRTVKTQAELLRWINNELPGDFRITKEVWQSRLYDVYMDCVNELHCSAGDAQAYGKSLLRKIENEYDGVE